MFQEDNNDSLSANRDNTNDQNVTGTHRSPFPSLQYSEIMGMLNKRVEVVYANTR